MTKKRVVSGIQATGNIHLGNYLGAIKNWLNLQNDYECFFFIADLHAITVHQDPENLHRSIIYTAATYLACGLDPQNVQIFAQSSIKEHTELTWLFSCSTAIGWLNRMTQFKDKSGINNKNANLGLYAYPVLMSADILLYDADIVPVGEDQKQHLELARDIALAINNKFNHNIFRLPEPLIKSDSKRIMSLKDATKKMSKSDLSEQSRINLTDDSVEIAKKFKKAQTDSYDKIYYDEENRPAISNLLNIYSNISGDSIVKITKLYDGKNFSSFKNDVAELVINELSPITSKLKYYLNNQDYILQILKQGADKARQTAAHQLANIKRHYGFLDV